MTMHHVSEGIRRPSDGKCCIPGCLKDVSPTGKYLCASCEEKAAVLDAQRKRAEYDRACKRPRETILRRVEAAIPSRYGDVRFPLEETDTDAQFAAFETIRSRLNCRNPDEAFKQTVEAAELVLKKRGAVVLFVGPSGAGKTTLMSLLFRIVACKVPLLPRHKNPVCVKGGLFFDDWEEENPLVSWTSAEALFYASKDDTNFMDALKRVPLLGIDDIGGEPHQVNAQGVQSVVWARHDADRAIVGTTGFYNLDASPDDPPETFLSPLKDRYGMAFVRRLVLLGPDMCRIIPVLP